ncbi:hypothetical protein HB364_19945 [Pseudoflavitalea sp. X16]|nr:hypothetical protein [Paraflavitalea devenefica]
MLEKELLRRYLDGQCTEEEKLLVRKYLAGNDNNLPGMDALLHDSWQQSNNAIVPEEETMKHLQKLRDQLYPDVNGVVPMRRRSLRYLYYAAAVMVAAIVIPLFLWRSPKPEQVVAVAVWDSVSNAGSTSIHITLPDSSTAWISPNSTLRWNMHNHGRRIVQLEGEAFFDVTHHRDAPFIVQTGNINTRVLGTAFNIESYRHEPAVRVSLVRGKVAIEKQWAGPDHIQTIETLQPGEMLSYRKADSTTRKETLIITDIRQWTGGYLVLNDVPLPDALRRIAARNHVSFIYDDKISNSRKRVSTVFKNETTGQMLDIIGFITGCQHRKKGNDQIEIY